MNGIDLELSRLAHELFNVPAQSYARDMVFQPDSFGADGPEAIRRYDAFLLNRLLPELRPDCVYHLHTRNETVFTLWLDTSDPGQKVVVLGPYLTCATGEDMMDAIMERNHFTIAMEIPLRMCYATIPIAECKSIERCIFTALGRTLPVQIVLWETLDEDYPTAVSDTDVVSEEMMRCLVERYELEDRWLDAVSRGDAGAAVAYCRQFRDITNVHGIRDRLPDRLRNKKNFCIVGNTMLRKAAQRGVVHPVYLDAVSAQYHIRIEMLKTAEQAERLDEEMTMEYANLVKKYSLASYTPLVRHAVNYINLNLSTPLTLQSISAQIGVSETYLSTLFNREIGKSLKDFVNGQRVQVAKHLLRVSHAAVSTIATQVGFADAGYFARVFRQYEGVTPRQYRAAAAQEREKY